MSRIQKSKGIQGNSETLGTKSGSQTKAEERKRSDGKEMARMLLQQNKSYSKIPAFNIKLWLLENLTLSATSQMVTVYD